MQRENADKNINNESYNPKINVFVKSQNGENMCMYVDSGEDIDTIKNMILIQSNHDQVSKNLEQKYGKCIIRDLFLVSLVFSFIQKTIGKFYEKYLLEDEKNRMFLHCNGKILQPYGMNGRECLSLHDLGIQNNHTIFVSQEQQGGCFIATLTVLMIISFAFLTSSCTCGLSLCIVPYLLPLIFILPLFCL